jgi:hypothetical protein
LKTPSTMNQQLATTTSDRSSSRVRPASLSAGASARLRIAMPVCQAWPSACVTCRMHASYIFRPECGPRH